VLPADETTGVEARAAERKGRLGIVDVTPPGRIRTACKPFDLMCRFYGICLCAKKKKKKKKKKKTEEFNRTNWKVFIG